jgi:hypothetical protein
MDKQTGEEKIQVSSGEVEVYESHQRSHGEIHIE